MERTNCILHPTDFSHHASTAFKVACSLAHERKLRLVVLHVVPSHEPVAHYAKALGLEPPVEAQVELKTYREEMERKLRTVRPTDHHIPMEYVLKEGVVAQEIVRAAEGMQCESIVMGSRGQSPPSRAIFGSVAEEVCRASPCPVVTVREPDR